MLNEIELIYAENDGTDTRSREYTDSREEFKGRRSKEAKDGNSGTKFVKDINLSNRVDNIQCIDSQLSI
jgi:hypothetical protein